MVKGKYVEKILSGEKKATIRLGIVKPKYDEIFIHGGGRPVALARIVKVSHKKVRDLTDNDALKDGFSSRKELLKELRKNYDKLNPDDYVTIIEFEVIKKLSELDYKDPWLGLKPAEIARIGLRYCTDLSDEEKRVLEDLTRTESLRKTAIRLYGNISKRWIIRKVLRRVLKKLIEKGVLGQKIDSEKNK
ncbi:MAG: ASCH domain-containing protein [Desulfurococcales archaeon ex4484_217_2]|nr:MAG: ASCH domain-containing protein [Desulfurococcales archaeon ex4484_217_2]